MKEEGPELNWKGRAHFLGIADFPIFWDFLPFEAPAAVFISSPLG
jgi:hypothetical protein